MKGEFTKSGAKLHIFFEICKFHDSKSLSLLHSNALNSLLEHANNRSYCTY